VIRDPQRRGHVLADFFLSVERRLYADLAESGVLPVEEPAAASTGAAIPAGHARAEWECFALYACVRGLVAAGGFNRETAAAIDALHERVIEAWGEGGAPATGAARSDRIAERYAEYGGIGQAGGAAGAATVTRRLGEAAARHMARRDPPPPALAELVGALHETLAEGAAEAVRQAE
jgi:hypothetical protein